MSVRACATLVSMITDSVASSQTAIYRHDVVGSVAVEIYDHEYGEHFEVNKEHRDFRIPLGRGSNPKPAPGGYHRIHSPENVCAGDEVRLEPAHGFYLHQIPNVGTHVLDLRGEVRLYEGGGCDTDDLDGKEVVAGDAAENFLPNRKHKQVIVVRNGGEGYVGADLGENLTIRIPVGGGDWAKLTIWWVFFTGLEKDVLELAPDLLPPGYGYP